MSTDIPEEITMALAVIDRLDQDDQAEFLALKKALPILAVKLQQAGEAVTEEILEDYALQGSSFIAEAIKTLAPSSQKNKSGPSYEDVVNSFVPMEAIAEFIDQMDNDENVEINDFFRTCMEEPLDEVKKAYHDGLDITVDGHIFLRETIAGGLIDVANFLISKGADLAYLRPEDILNLFNCGDEEAALNVLDFFREDDIFLGDMLMLSARYGYTEVIDHLYGRGFDVLIDEGDALLWAARNGDLKTVKFLHEIAGADINMHDNAVVVEAMHSGDDETLAYVLEAGGTLEEFSDDEVIQLIEGCSLNIIMTLMLKHSRVAMRGPVMKKITEINESTMKWRALNPLETEMPPNCHRLNPHYYNNELYMYLCDLLEHEAAEHISTHAYNAAALFGSEERVMAYLEKWGTQGKQPLYDLIRHVSFPKEGRIDLKSWSDAVMQNGTAMAVLVQFADRFPQPERSACGRQYSVAKTRESVAEFVYPNGAKDKDFAKFSIGYLWSEEAFEKGRVAIESYNELYGHLDAPKPGQSIPDIKIDGALFDKPKYNFYKLKDGDLRGLALGEHVDCCQHLNNAGSACAKHGFLSPHGGFYVVADKENDEIIAESWAWRGKKGEVVLDSLEFLDGRMDPNNWQKLLGCLSDEFKKYADITALHLGPRGDTPAALPTPIFSKITGVENLAHPIDYVGYRDTKRTQFQIFKR